MALQLTSASTGLMRSADDGKGTVVRFSYGRSRPAPRANRRHSVLTGMTMESSGYDPVTFGYDYADPVAHTEGKYLVGFDSVDKHSPALAEHVALLNDDDISGVESSSEDTDDRTPAILRFSRKSYEDVTLQGIRWLRPTQVERGYRNSAGTVTLSSTTTYTTYERDFCPTVTVTSTPSGQLTATSALASVTAIPDDLHCLARSQSLFGVHADATHDFHYLIDLARNDLGQVTRVTQYGAAMQFLVLQDVAYNTEHRISSITMPGRGATTPGYDTLGRLASVTSPTGVAAQVDSFDSVSDALLALKTVRPNANLTAFVQYDGRERLQASWDDFSGGNRDQPLTSYRYQDPTSTTPGRIDTAALADAIAGVSRHAVALVAADGEPMVEGTWVGDRFALGTLATTLRNTLTRTASVVGPMRDDEITELTSEGLRALGKPVATTVHGGFGHPIEVTTLHQEAVVGTTNIELVLNSSELITRSHDPGGFAAESALDAAGRLTRKTDENGVVHSYGYDALGRI
ncbi:MAG: RHS repeat domain-containing protein, partial [bacterium]